MSDCRFCAIVSKGAGHALMCVPCYMGRKWLQPAPEAVRRSRRLAAKPRVSYTEEKLLSELQQRSLDRRGGLTWNQFVAGVRVECDCTYAEALMEASRRLKGALPRTAADFEEGRLYRLAARAAAVHAKATAAADRQDREKRRRAERIIARMARDMEILAAMPATPPRLARQDAVPWAPPHGPALSRTEATGCADLPPPPPLRRTCQLPGCDEWCSYCRENDRIAAYNRANPIYLPAPPATLPPVWDRPPSSSAGGVGGLAPSSSAGGVGGLAPPPIGAAVIRVPIDMAQMTAAALRMLIAAAQNALDSK